MTLRGIDISNLQGSPSQYRSEQWYADAEFVIVQAIPRPRPNGLAGDQLRAARDDGKHVGIYTWLWHDSTWRLDPDVGNDQRARLATVPDDVALDMRVWLDVEDNQSTAWAGSGVQGRKDDVMLALDAINTWSSARGLPEAGIYTSRYFINLLFDGWMPSGVKLWLASYGVTPGSLIGGDCVAHQYGSTPIDMDVMLESEIVTGGPPVDDAERAAMQAQIDSLVTTVADIADRLGDQLLAECKRSSVRKTTVRGIVAEMEAERVQAVGPRP
jgi:hypothetical protein